MNNTLFDALDFGAALRAALRSVQRARGIEARTQAAMFLLVCLVDLPFVWYFDIEPTLEWSSQATAALLPSFPAFLIVGPWLLLLLTLAPTVMEFGLSGIAASGVKLAGIAVYAISLFDVVTDKPRVDATIAAAQSFFTESFGQFTGIVQAAAWCGLMAMATAGFELIFAVCFVCGVLCLLNSKSSIGSPTA